MLGCGRCRIWLPLKRRDPDVLISATDIRSERKAIREKHPNGRSPIETLPDDLSTLEWIFAVKKDIDVYIYSLFFAY